MMINPKEQGEPRIAGNQALVTPKLAFVFPGTGPEWWAMGRQLLQEEPTFLNKIQECDALFRKHVDWSLWDELTAEEHESRIKSTQIAQPAIFALQVALATLWRSWGIEPDVAVGQSLGEVAAAHVAGVLSLQDAVQVIFHRSRLQATTAGQGKTLSVALSEQEADLFGNHSHNLGGAVVSIGETRIHSSTFRNNTAGNGGGVVVVVVFVVIVVVVDVVVTVVRVARPLSTSKDCSVPHLLIQRRHNKRRSCTSARTYSNIT